MSETVTTPEPEHEAGARYLGEHPVDRVVHFGEAEVRVVMIDGEPWFIAADIAKALGHVNHRQAVAAADLDANEVGVILNDTKQADQYGAEAPPRRRLLVVSESGVYGLLMSSRKELAKSFRRWLRQDVLPSLRRTGHYRLPETLPEPEQPRRVGGLARLLDHPDELRGAIGLVRELRMLYGKRASRAIAREVLDMVDLDGLVEEVGEPLDPVRRWSRQCLVRAAGDHAAASVLYAHFCAWCDDQDMKPLSRAGWGRQMRALGWEKRSSNGRVLYCDCRIGGE